MMPLKRDAAMFTHPTEAEPFRRLFHQGIILGEDGEKMSKSRGNVVNPDTIIQSHGTDTLRLYLMFLGPLEAMKPWNPRGIEGVHRFLQKVWRECVGPDGAVPAKLSAEAAEDPALTRLLHETIRKVGDDIEALRFNTAISQMMIFVNALQKAPAARTGTVRAFLQLLAPFAPHLGEELWSMLGHEGTITYRPFPTADPALLVDDTVEIPVQIQGKLRGRIVVPAGADAAALEAAAAADPKIAEQLAGRTIAKVVAVPGRMINFVLATQGSQP